MSKTYQSELSAAIHETALDMYDVGIIDKRTMKEFDKTCLSFPEELSPDEIRAIRMDASVSQSVFALYLNVSPGVVSQWERGEKHPAGASLKLLTLVRKKGLAAIA